MSLHLLESLGLVTIGGQDASKLLQGQLTINPEKITNSEFSMAAVCNHQGRCIAVFWITRESDSFQCVMPKANIENFISHLKKYAVFYKVEIDSPESSIIGSVENSEVIPRDIDSNTIESLKMINSQFAHIKLSVHPPLASAADLENESNWFVELAKAGICWIDDKGSSSFLPHNINLPNLGAVDFKKGCFTGQEVIARMQYKGKLKSHLQLLTADQPLSVHTGEKLECEGKNCGEVVCSAVLDGNVTYVLVILKDSYLNSKNFQLASKNEPILKLSEK